MPSTEFEGRPLRLVVYDRTCVTGHPWPGLSRYWRAGTWLYAGLQRIDACRGVSSWAEALQWLGTEQPERRVAEVQFWGHGKWGQARIGSEVFNARTLLHTSPLHAALGRFGARLAAEEALFWFRTCESFGALEGQDFARAMADRLGCRVAGHTYVIGYWQSGLHSLRPGAGPAWSSDEGLCDGTAAAPRRAAVSSRRAPNSITCLDGRIPRGF